jgi:2-succinyl-5-enolpyruvyl-6-hydroxy-3-cyclohexene-1-carboxylate synthase
VSHTLLAEWARLIFGTLRAAGVSDVVVSPGSRSTPFAYAALTTHGLSCHSAWDERSAGFFALGQARLTGRPSALLCTSGSAVANYFPAVAEAAYANLPLVVLSADRPFELQDVGAAQCMDQVKLFGDLVRRFFDLGHPDASDAALDSAQRLIARAVEHARAPAPGPVHVNLRARKPLEPKAAQTEDELALAASVDARLARGPGKISSRQGGEAPPEDVRAIAEACGSHDKGVIVLGPLGAHEAGDFSAVFELSERTGYPIFAEATSQLRFAVPEKRTVLGALDAWLRHRRLIPDFVLQLGATPTSGEFERFTREEDVTRAVVSPHGFPDPSHHARWLIEADPIGFCRSLLAELPDSLSSVPRTAFAIGLRYADAAYFRILASELPSDGFSEASAVRAALAALPQHGLLGVGNSLPIRDVDAFVPPRAGRVRVWSQRGLNGIDGLVSGAIGASRASGLPQLCLLGDVSFLHDQGGLALAATLDSPLALVVLDNGGGRIFEHLPVSQLLAEREDLARFWTTPQSYDLSHAAALYGLSFASPTSDAELTRAVGAALERKGCTLIQARVPADSARSLSARVRERFEQS